MRALMGSCTCQPTSNWEPISTAMLARGWPSTLPRGPWAFLLNELPRSSEVGRGVACALQNHIDNGVKEHVTAG